MLHVPHAPWWIVEDIGDRYITEMVRSIAVVGNSSSGIIEAPSCGTWTVNIGDRQHGRERSHSVVDIPVDKDEIIQTIKSIRNYDIHLHNPYDKPGTRRAISDFLLNCDLTFAK